MPSGVSQTARRRWRRAGGSAALQAMAALKSGIIARLRSIWSMRGLSSGSQNTAPSSADGRFVGCQRFDRPLGRRAG